MTIVSLPLRVRTPLSGAVSNWGELVRRVRNPYRPELHYMRGLGPKCRAICEARSGDGAL
jgi:hypothetical protein